MKIIDLLNKIANGEKVPKKIRVDHWCYIFEWKEHESNYYDKHEDIDLMSCLSMNKEEFNYEVHELKEDNKIKPLLGHYTGEAFKSKVQDKINEIIDKINEDKNV